MFSRIICLLKGHKWSSWSYSWVFHWRLRICDRCFKAEYSENDSKGNTYQGATIMKTITRAGLSRRNIIIHRKGSRFMYYYRKSIDRGYVVLWAGDGMICLTN